MKEWQTRWLWGTKMKGTKETIRKKGLSAGGRRGKTKSSLRGHDCRRCSIKQLLSCLVHVLECLFACEEGTRLGGSS